MTLHGIPLIPLLFAVGVLLVIALAVWLQRHSGEGDFEPLTEFPYRRAETVLAGPEAALFQALEDAVGPGFRVLAKVRLADLLEIDARPRSSRWQRAFARVADLRVDFVVCVRASGRILGVVTLEAEDSPPPEDSRRERFLERTLATAGIPVARLSGEEPYDSLGIREQLQRAWDVSLLPPRSPAGAASERSPFHCPDCGAPLLAKVVASGPHTGRRYLKCSRFPECRRILPAPEPPPAPRAEAERPFTMGRPAPGEDDSRRI